VLHDANIALRRVASMLPFWRHCVVGRGERCSWTIRHEPWSFTKTSVERTFRWIVTAPALNEYEE